MVLEKLKNSMTYEEVENKFYQNLEFGFLNIVDQTTKKSFADTFFEKQILNHLFNFLTSIIK